MRLFTQPLLKQTHIKLLTHDLPLSRKGRDMSKHTSRLPSPKGTISNGPKNEFPHNEKGLSLVMFEYELSPAPDSCIKHLVPRRWHYLEEQWEFVGSCWRR